MATLTENVKRVTDALNDIETSIKNKGQTPTGKCETYAAAIDAIQTGTDVSDTTATAYDVVSGKKFYNSYGNKTEGLMTEHLNENFTPVLYENGELPPEYELEDGYYGNCKIEPVKYQFPSADKIKYGVQIKLNDEVMVTGTYLDKYTVTTATADDVLKGRVFINKFGYVTTGTLADEPFIKTYTPRNEAMSWFDMPTNIIKSVWATIEGAKISDASHLLEGDALVTVDLEGNVTSTITEGTMPNNGAITKTLESGEVYTIPEGYHNGSGTITAPSGGGSLFSAGTFTTNTNGTKITLPFKPKVVIVSSAFSQSISGSYQGTETVIWENSSNNSPFTNAATSGGVIEYFTSASATSGATVSKTSTTWINRIFVDNTGFTHNARIGNKTAYYVAIG